MDRKRVAARASDAAAEAPRGKTGRTNKKAENRFSHANAVEGVPPPPPKGKRSHPSLQAELVLRGITMAELTERAHAFDNNTSVQEVDRLASAVVAYLSKLTSKNRRVQWCVIPGFVFDSRKTESTALINEGWAGYEWTYKPEEYVSVSAEFEKLERSARERLLTEVKAYPSVERWVHKMGNTWEPKTAQEATAREMVTEWLIMRSTARR